jgi:glycosyltransferase involved in cell wall biosynthesis
MTMKISVVIPAFNEEDLLPELLGDVRRQTFGECEIIVADAGSTDRTRALAREFDARVVAGGSPAAGRNRGAEAAQGSFLFFLDADVRLPETFLENAQTEIEERFLDLATCDVTPLSDQNADRLWYDIANFAIKLTQYSDPHANGFCILVSKRLFHRTGGFDESIKIAEDNDFVKRAGRFRPLRVLHSTQVSVSVRRLEKEGRIGLVNKYLAVELHRIFLGEVRDDFVEYEFGNFDGQDGSGKDRFEESRTLMERLQERYTDLISEFGESAPGEKLDEIRRQFDEMNDQLTSWLAARREPTGHKDRP